MPKKYNDYAPCGKAASSVCQYVGFFSINQSYLAGKNLILMRLIPDINGAFGALRKFRNKSDINVKPVKGNAHSGLTKQSIEVVL